jgi:hypothetical protein
VAAAGVLRWVERHAVAAAGAGTASRGRCCWLAALDHSRGVGRKLVTAQATLRNNRHGAIVTSP